MILYDSQGNVIQNLQSLGGQTITDARTTLQTINTLNGEVLLDIINEGSSTLDIRGTFTATLNCEFTTNGTDYIALPVFNTATEIWQGTITAVGNYVLDIPSATKRIRVRASAYTSGPINVYLRASTDRNLITAKAVPANLLATVTATIGLAATLTIGAPGAGLYTYITNIHITKFAGALLIAAATPVLVTTTNINGSPVFSFSAGAEAQGSTQVIDMGYSGNPLRTTTANTATTIVCPATTSVIWRVLVSYFVK